MAQPGNFTPILLYGSSTPGNAPLAANLTNSAIGSEIAINVADKNLFFKDSGGVVNTVPIRQSSASSNGWLSSTDWSAFNGKAASFTYTTNYIPYGQGTTTPALSPNLQFDGNNLSVGGKGFFGSITALTSLGTTPVQAAGQIWASQTFTLSSTTPVNIATLTSGIVVVRDATSGGTALLLYESGVDPIIVSQSGSNFTTGTPGATQIRVYSTGAQSIGAITGSSISGNTVATGVFFCQ